jgi:hypothetical protein
VSILLSSKARQHNQKPTALRQPGATGADLATANYLWFQLLRASWVGGGWVPRRLKIRVSVVRFRPWPPLNQQLPCSAYRANCPEALDPRADMRGARAAIVKCLLCRPTLLGYDAWCSPALTTCICACYTESLDNRASN